MSRAAAPGEVRAGSGAARGARGDAASHANWSIRGARLNSSRRWACAGLCSPAWGALDGEGRFSSETAFLLVPSSLSHEVWKGGTTVCAETVCVNPLD